MLPKYEWDETKAKANYKKHKFSFEKIYAFDWTSVVVKEDMRREYGELRYSVMGLIGDRLFNLVMTRRGETIRVISLRKANDRERKYYEEEKNYT